MGSSNTFEFVTDELYLLLGFFGPCISFGLGEPYLGKFAEEIESAMSQAQNSLIEHGYVRVRENGEVAIDEGIAKIIKVCAHPDHTAIITTQKTGKPKQILYIHFSPDLLVEQSSQVKDKHRLVPIPSRDEMLVRLIKQLHLNGQSPAEDGRFRLPEKALFEARDLIGEGHKRKASKCLEEAGLSEKHTKILVHALGTPSSNSSVAVVINRDEPDIQHVNGLGVFESEKQMWALLPIPDPKGNQVEFIPSSAQEIEARLRDLMPA
jgi:hypothetical protein